MASEGGGIYRKSQAKGKDWGEEKRGMTRKTLNEGRSQGEGGTLWKKAHMKRIVTTQAKGLKMWGIMRKSACGMKKKKESMGWTEPSSAKNDKEKGRKMEKSWGERWGALGHGRGEWETDVKR